MIIKAFPLKLELNWGEDAKLRKIKIELNLNFAEPLFILDKEEEKKFLKKFWLAFLEYWNFKAGFVDVEHHMELTEFEKQVLEETRKIPPGEVITYKELAERIGCPMGYRAVGRALARNPLPLVYPCHRVIATSGYGGYTGGLVLKYFLLLREKLKDNFFAYLSKFRQELS